MATNPARRRRMRPLRAGWRKDGVCGSRVRPLERTSTIYCERAGRGRADGGTCGGAERPAERRVGQGRERQAAQEPKKYSGRDEADGGERPLRRVQGPAPY